MSKEQKPIEPEIVNEIPKQENKNVNISKSKKGLSWVFLALAVIYIFSPFDIVPDFLPLLGWLDDVAVGLLAVINFINQQKSKQG